MLDWEALGCSPAARDSATGGPELDEGETVLHKFERLQLVVGAAADQGEGTLFITEGRIVWLSSSDAQLGVSCDFTAVAMHAVVSDAESGGRPSLYLQLDTGAEEEGEGGLGAFAGLASAVAAARGQQQEQQPAAAAGEQDEDEEEGAAGPELRLVPADASQLEPLFQAFCEGAERNPDWSEDEEGEEGEGFFYDEDAALAGAAAAALGVGDVEELVGGDPGRFEDADGEDAEGDGFEEFEEQAAGSSGQQNGGC